MYLEDFKFLIGKVTISSYVTGILYLCLIEEFELY